MRECINIHLGQAGCQGGTACWDLYCQEHALGKDGRLEDSTGDAVPPSTFFVETPNGKFVPKSVFVDLEPTVIDQIRTGAQRELFHPERLLSGKEDAANNYARGYYTTGRTMSAPLLEQVRKLAEQSAGVQGFVLLHSTGGGTGAGLTAYLMEQLRSLYPKKDTVQLAVYPGRQLSSAVVEPYNAVLATNAARHYSSLSVVTDNQALYELCQSGPNIARPSFAEVNCLEAQLAASLTASMRFPDGDNADLAQLQTNLVPFPRIHFATAAYAPLASVDKALYEAQSVRDITNASFDGNQRTVQCGGASGRALACCVLYRGDVTPREMNAAIAEVRRLRRLHFVRWCPTGFKVSLAGGRPGVVPDGPFARPLRSVCALSNTTALTHAWAQLALKFDSMFAKRAFLHHFVAEGLEHAEFVDARRELDALQNEYKQIGND